MPKSWSAFVSVLIHLVSWCPGPGGKCAVRYTVSLTVVTTFTAWLHSFSALLFVSSAIHVAHNNISKTSTRSLARWRRQANLPDYCCCIQSRTSHPARARPCPALDYNLSFRDCKCRQSPEWWIYDASDADVTEWYLICLLTTAMIHNLQYNLPRWSTMYSRTRITVS